MFDKLRYSGRPTFPLMSFLAFSAMAIGFPQPPSAASPSEDAQPLVLDLGGGVTIELVLIPAGEFLMGSPKNEKDRHGNDVTELQHPRKIPAPFYMGVYEITQKQWFAVMGENPAYRKGDDLPITKVSWERVNYFCDKLSERLGRKVRLPWEAEWEYACRAGTTTAFSCGETEADLLAYAWFFKNKEKDNVHPVGNKKPNAWGLYDMHGNAQEWCMDQFEPYSLDLSPPYKPARSGVEGPTEKDIIYRVCRGGRFNDYASGCRSACRGFSAGNQGAEDGLGFRIVVESQSGNAKPVGPKAPPGPTGEKPLVIDLGGGVTMEMVALPAGEFLMGVRAAERPSEAQHKRRITKPFFIGRYEITQKQWRTVMGENPSKQKGDDLPVGNVSWDDAQKFCARLSGLCKHAFRLPWEAEWEYACRAGTTTDFSFGDSPAELKDYAWYADNGGGQTHPVGKLKPNAWGLYDMHGNAEEWCEDWYGVYSRVGAADEKGPPEDNGTGRRMTRSANGSRAQDVRSCSRGGHSPATAFETLGLRVVCESPYTGARIAVDSESKPATPTAATAAPPQSPTGEPPLVIDLGKGATIELVSLPAGEFLMGTPNAERQKLGRQSFFEVQHKRKISQPFHIGRFEVTQKQWNAIMEKNPSPRKGDDLPVVNVNGQDMQVFCAKLSELTKRVIRLPWEAEWEYACRAGTTTRYGFGDQPDDLKEYAWSHENARGEAHPVGKLKPNAWGLYDMHGNVWEWVNDWYAEYPQGALLDTAGPTSDPGSMKRARRGGSFGSDSSEARSANRSPGYPKWGAADAGFRIVAEKAGSFTPSNTIEAAPKTAAKDVSKPESPASTDDFALGAHNVYSTGADGTQRQGKVVVDRKGAVYGLTFDYQGEPQLQGVGVNKDMRPSGNNELWLAYGTPKTVGLAVYEIRGGTLEGTWYPWYAADGDARNLGTETLSGPESLNGDFTITAASAPNTGIAYGGKVTITPTDVVLDGSVKTFSLKWTIGDATFAGVGVRINNFLIVSSGSGEDFGVARFKIDKFDALIGDGFSNKNAKGAHRLTR